MIILDNLFWHAVVFLLAVFLYILHHSPSLTRKCLAHLYPA